MQELFEKWIEQSIFSASFLVTIWKWKVEMTPRQNFFDWCCLKIVKKSGLLEEPLSDKQPFIFLHLLQ